MKHSIEVMTDLPVVIVQFEEGFGSAEDIQAYVEEIGQTYETLDKKVYNITDTTNLNLTFDKVMEFLRVSMRSDYNLASHPMKLGNIVITTSTFYNAVIKGLRSASFGNMNIEVFDSVDAALKWVRERAA